MIKSAICKVCITFLLVSIDGLAYADSQVSNTASPTKTMSTDITVGQIVAENAHIYRKIIEITDHHQYIVQNFYKQTHHKQSDPLIINDPSKLPIFQELQIYNLKNLMFDGALVLWFDNGKKSMSININQGNAEGPFNSYYISGSQEIEGYYFAGKPDGLWKYWTQEGKLNKQVYYQQGIIQWQKSSIQIQGL